MEAENISLKEKIRNLENENLSLKTNVEEIKINMVEKTNEVAEINLKLDNIRESIPTVNVEGNIGNNAKKLSFAAVLRNGNTAVIADKIVEETKERNNKEKNIIITGVNLDNLQDGKSPLDIVTELLQSIDASATFTEFIRFKKDKNYINKAMVTMSTKIMRDTIVSKSKHILRGQNIYINNDLTKLEMQAEYELREEKRNQINKLEGDDKNKYSFYIRNKSLWVFDKVEKVHSIAKRN